MNKRCFDLTSRVLLLFFASKMHKGPLTPLYLVCYPFLACPTNENGQAKAMSATRLRSSSDIGLHGRFHIARQKYAGFLRRSINLSSFQRCPEKLKTHLIRGEGNSLEKGKGFTIMHSVVWYYEGIELLQKTVYRVKAIGLQSFRGDYFAIAVLAELKRLIPD